VISIWLIVAVGLLMAVGLMADRIEPALTSMSDDELCLRYELVDFVRVLEDDQFDVGGWAELEMA